MKYNTIGDTRNKSDEVTPVRYAPQIYLTRSSSPQSKILEIDPQKKSYETRFIKNQGPS